MKPIVSIIMATYNRAHFIVETLESIQAQTYTDWECLIIDDGGTDNTEEVITPILEQDYRFKFFKRSNAYKKGLPGCRNYGLDIAQGTYIQFFDDDDIVHPQNLESCVKIFMGNEIDFCHYQKQSFEQVKPTVEFLPIKIVKSISKINIEEVVMNKIGLASCTVLWNVKCFNRIRFKEELLYAEEWECFTRIISQNYSGIMIENVLYFNRKHPNSNTGEFYNNNPIRKESKKDAILLVINNLNEKKLLSNTLFRYFIQMALQFEEYRLFNSILDIVKLSPSQQLKWKVFNAFLPFRLYVYRLKKNLITKK